MLSLSAEIITLLSDFAFWFDKRVRDHAVVFVIGAILNAR